VRALAHPKMTARNGGKDGRRSAYRDLLNFNDVRTALVEFGEHICLSP